MDGRQNGTAPEFRRGISPGSMNETQPAWIGQQTPGAFPEGPISPVSIRPPQPSAHRSSVPTSPDRSAYYASAPQSAVSPIQGSPRRMSVDRRMPARQASPFPDIVPGGGYGNQTLRDIDNLYGGRRMTPSPDLPGEHERNHSPPFAAAVHRNSQTSMDVPLMPRTLSPQRQLSPQPRAYLGPDMAAFGNTSYEGRAPGRVPYKGDGYDDAFDPRDFAEDIDDGADDHRPRRRYPMGMAAGATAAGLGAGLGAKLSRSFGTGSLRSLARRSQMSFGARSQGGSYEAIGVGQDRDPEKSSEWLQQQKKGSQKFKWFVAALISVLLIAASTVGLVAMVSRKHAKNSAGSSSSGSSNSSGGLYDINSPEVKKLLNNPNLHRVFPGIDYTPLDAQYPGCLSTPPDANNVTLDVVMMSQLSPTVRLYGTDCNQTELVLSAIDRLGYNDSMKVWLGVYLDNNSTTNARQLSQMYDILDKWPASAFAGVIVGNEVLFREDMSAAELGTVLSGVRSNLTAKGIDLPVSTADLGVSWTENPLLAGTSDIIMANVHPFFGGVPADEGSSWAWLFWQENDAKLMPANTGKYPKTIISEIGWPSEGGTDCGTQDYKCLPGQVGAVASIDGINTFLDGWVCDSLTNSTNYFYFEAFDEPWKVIFNSGEDQWEPHWGLMDANRNLKDGIKIPDCNGKQAALPSW